MNSASDERQTSKPHYASGVPWRPHQRPNPLVNQAPSGRQSSPSNSSRLCSQTRLRSASAGVPPISRADKRHPPQAARALAEIQRATNGAATSTSEPQTQTSRESRTAEATCSTATTTTDQPLATAASGLNTSSVIEDQKNLHLHTARW